MNELPTTFTKIASASQGDGGLLWLLLALAVTVVGLLYFTTLAARPTGDPLSRWSPCILLGVVAAMIALVVEDRLLIIPDAWLARSARCLVALLTLAPAMAIAGLLSRDQPRAWVPAGWCLLLSGLTLVGPFVELSEWNNRSPNAVASTTPDKTTGVRQAALHSRPRPKPSSKATHTSAGKSPRQQRVAVHHDTTPRTVIASPSSSRTSEADFVFPQLNFSYTLPSSKWRRLEHLPGDQVIPDLALALRRNMPTITAGIFAVPMPFKCEDRDILNEVIRKGQEFYPGCTVAPITSRTVAGVEGVSVDIKHIGPYRQVSIRNWVGSHAGIAYQITFESHSSSLKNFSEFAAGFQLIDFAQNDPGPVNVNTSPYDFGYRLTLDEEGWVRTNELHTAPWIDHMAIRPLSDDAVAVISLPAPTTDLEGFGEVVTQLLNLPEADLNRVSDSGAHVALANRVIDYEGIRRTSTGKMPCRLRLVAGPHSAHAILAATQQRDTSVLLEMLDTFQLTGEPPTAEPPANPSSRSAIAELANEVGLREYTKGEKRAAVEKFRLAVEYEPQHEVYADNFVTTFADIEGPQAALDLLASNPPKALGEAALALLRAHLLSELNRFDEALDAFAEAAAAGPLDDESLLAMGNVAVAANHYGETLAALDEAIDQRGGPRLANWRAVMMGRAGRHDEAISALERQAQASPHDGPIAYSLAEAYEEAERYAEGVRVCQAALERFPDDADLLALLGRLRLGEGDFDAARMALQDCLAKNPAHVEAAELLTHLSAMMGRGNNRRITEPIEAAPLHPMLAEALRRATNHEVSEQAAAAGVYDEHRVTTYVYEQGQPLRVTERMRFRILNRTGVEAMTLLNTTFNPLSERLFVNELVVRDERNVEIGRGSIDDYYVMDDSADGLDSYDQVVKLPVPGVRPGCTIEVTLTTEKLSASASFGYHTHFLSGSTGCGLNAVCVVGDTDRVEFRSRGVQEVRPDGRTIAWIAANTSPEVDEPFQPDPAEYLPVVQLCDAGQSWQSITRDYLTDLTESLSRDSEVQRLASELIDPADSPTRRIEVLSRHVQEAITYQGLEFGVRGVIPHPVARVCRVGTGDCKDHALLLHHLLREAGIPSYLALVNSSGSVEPDLPSLDQFDHMVVAIPNMPCRDGSISTIGLIDPTQKTVDPLKGVPNGMAGKQILVLDENRSGLDTLPAVSATDGLIACNRRAAIAFESPGSGTASLHVSEQVVFGSSLSSLLRMMLQGDTPQGQRETLQRMIADRRAVEVKEAYAEHLDDPTKPLIIHCQYVVTDAFQEVAIQGKPLTGILPGHWAELYCSPEKISDRQTPFKFSIPVTFRCETQLVAPTGYRVALDSVKPLGKKMGPIMWSWRMESEPPGTARFTLELRRSVGTFAADEYAAYQVAAEEALRATGRAITIARTELASRP